MRCYATVREKASRRPAGAAPFGSPLTTASLREFSNYERLRAIYVLHVACRQRASFCKSVQRQRPGMT